MIRLPRLRCLLALPALAVGMCALAADQPKVEQAKPKAEQKPAKKKSARYETMDYGPMLSASIQTWLNSDFDNGPGSFTGDTTARGMICKLSDDWHDAIVFDADTCRMSFGWLNGGIKFHGVIFDGGHGPNSSPTIPPTFQTPNAPGWANPENGSFDDPRADTIKPLPRPGNLPKEWSHYKGMYRHGDRVIFSYSVGTTTVLDQPSLESSGDARALVRTIRVDKSDKPLALRIAAAKVKVPAGKGKEILKEKPASVTGMLAEIGPERYAVVYAPQDAKLEFDSDQDLILRLPALSAPATFKVLISNTDQATGDFAALAKESPKPVDLVALTKGGPTRWPQFIETKGKLSTDVISPYVVDNLTLPYENPWGAWMRPGGFDFFTSDPTKAAICTWSGDVWIVSGIDEKLEHLKWKRFASGLHQALGLKIVDDKIYTVGHDQITRLTDLDGDGEADFYENFNSDWQITTAFHAFCFDLQTDPSGNFLFMLGSPVHAGGGGFQKISAHHGSVLRVTPDGSKLDIYATGFRAPNGMSVGPHGQVTSGDNQGTWVNASPLHWITPGSFNGVVDSAHGIPTHQPKALVFFPQSVDNSCGAQAWVPANDDKWGPFAGDLLHLSYGQSALFKVMKEEVDGQMQGGVVKFPLKFTSSAMRARFNKADQQLYVLGLSGWQSNAARDGGFDRVRFTGKNVYMPKELHATEKGMKITFTSPVDAQSAADTGNYSCEVWNYKWSGGYGSPEISTYDVKKEATTDQPKPKKKSDHEHDPMTIKSATVLPDGKTVFLEIEDMHPCWNMKIAYNIKAGDSTAMKSEIINTIHNLGKD